MTQDYTLLDTPSALQQFATAHEQVDWISLDTEFIGEKRFHTLLCLIQVVSPEGTFLIDPIELPDIVPLLQIIENPSITKITHAGDNDYRLFNELFDILPRNIFDTQIAAGFVGHRYPISFGKLVQEELGIRLNKGYGVTDWDTRPFEKKQLRYALNDVLPLYDLYEKIRDKLQKLGRLHWAEEEFRQLENPEYYERDPHREALNNNMMPNLQKKEQAFLLRLFAWRLETARQKDYSKEMVLPKKYIGHIVRSMRSGKDAMFKNRRLPNGYVKRHGSTFIDLYNQKITPEEEDILKRIPHDTKMDPQEELLLEMLRMLIEYKCLEEDVSADLALPRSILKKMKADPHYFDLTLKSGWREEFLGKQFLEWLEQREHLHLRMADGKVEFKLKTER